MLFKKSQHGWRLMQQGLQVFKEHKKLLVLPLLGRSFFFLVLVSTFVLIWFIRTGKIDYHQLSITTLIIGYAVLLLAFFIANLISFYFDAALSMCLLDYEQGKSPQISTALKQAIAKFPNIFLWLCSFFSFGLAVRFFPQKFKKNRLLSRLNWQFASFLVTALIINEGGRIFKMLKRSSQIIHTHFGDHPKINFSFIWIMVILRIIAFIPAIIAYSTRDKVWISIGMLSTGLLIFLIMMLQNALMVVLSQALYQYIVHQKTIRNFQARDLATSISA